MTGIRFRVFGFTLAIMLVAFLIAWATRSSLVKVSLLAGKLTSVQIESFQTADAFQARLQRLDYTLLRYQTSQDLADRTNFLHGWTNLNTWIDVQKPALTTPLEKQILDQIDAAYDDYFAAATNFLANIDHPNPARNPQASGFNKVEAQSQTLLNLASQLVAADQESLRQFLSDSQKSLLFLRSLIFIGLCLLLFLGVCLAGVVYRDMINPLRMKLVETHAILERQEKLASLGVLAAGVAHEIRNPLTAIKARLFTQQKALRSGSPELEDALVIGSEINRLERIVRDFLQFARPAEPRLVLLRASDVLQEAFDLLAPQLRKSGIEVQLELDANEVVRADPQQMKQVLINLIQNSAESIGQSGQIVLRVKPGTARLGNQNASVVILEICDNGRGISPEVQKRLFDPFFSTKESGTGLGLSIAARIVEKHGGVLEFQTQVNHGTTFGVVLPRPESRA